MKSQKFLLKVISITSFIAPLWLAYNIYLLISDEQLISNLFSTAYAFSLVLVFFGLKINLFTSLLRTTISLVLTTLVATFGYFYFDDFDPLHGKMYSVAVVLLIGFSIYFLFSDQKAKLGHAVTVASTLLACMILMFELSSISIIIILGLLVLLNLVLLIRNIIKH